jgi:hypothetical protein
MDRTLRIGPLEIDRSNFQSVGPVRYKMRLVLSIIIPAFLITCYDQALAAAPLLLEVNSTACPRQEPELIFWQTIMTSHFKFDYEAYLRKYPDGQFAELARKRLIRANHGRGAVMIRRLQSRAHRHKSPNP